MHPVRNACVRSWWPVLVFAALAACTRPAEKTEPALSGADSTSFRTELDSARVALMVGDIERAELMVRAVLTGATSAETVKQRSIALGYLGNIMQRRNDLDSAVACHRAVLAIAQELRLPETEATARINLGVALEMMGEHADALAQQLEAYRLKEQLGDSTGMARGLNNIGMLHVSTGDTLKARNSFLRSIAINEQVARTNGRTGDSASWHRSLMNLAVVEMDMGRYDTALVLLQRSNAVCPERMFNRNGAALLANMALAHEGRGDLEAARTLYAEALAMARQQEDIRALGELRHYLADLLVRIGQPTSALAHLDTALVIVRSIGDQATEKSVLLSQADALAAAGRHEAAFQAHKAYTALADSLMNAGKDAVMRELHVKYEVDQREHENERLRAAGELAEARARNLRWMVAAALLLAFAIGVVAWLLAQRSRERAKRREADLEQQALRAQMDPHFLFNSLNTIPGLYASSDARTATAYVGHLSNLLRLILESSRQVQVPLRQEVQLIKHYLHVSASRHPGMFTYAVAIDPAIDMDTVTIPPMLLQPLVENAILHGLVPRRTGGVLQVAIARTGHILECRIRDNGIGRVASAQRSERSLAPSRGMQITTERLQQFNRGTSVGYGLKVTDLHDPDGTAAGTEVTVRTIIHQPWT